MGSGDAIGGRISGTPEERARREQLLQALLDAFDTRGAEGVRSALESRLDALEQAFDGKLSSLNDLLPKGTPP